MSINFLVINQWPCRSWSRTTSGAYRGPLVSHLTGSAHMNDTCETMRIYTCVYMRVCVCMYICTRTRISIDSYGRFPKFHRFFLAETLAHWNPTSCHKKTSTINLSRFETLKLKIRRLKLWKPTVAMRIADASPHAKSNGSNAKTLTGRPVFMLGTFCADSSSLQISATLVGRLPGESDSLRKSPQFFAKLPQQTRRNISNPGSKHFLRQILLHAQSPKTLVMMTCSLFINEEITWLWLWL